MDSIKHFLDSVPAGTFPLLAAALGLSAFQQKIHKWLSVQNPKLKQAISVVLAVLLVVIPHALGILSANGQLLGAYTTLVFSAMTVFYRFLIKESPSLQNDLNSGSTVSQNQPKTVQDLIPDTADRSQPSQTDQLV